MDAWYYTDYTRNRQGPVRASDLAELHAGGQLTPDALVWREGMAQWQPWPSVMHEVLGSDAAARPVAGIGGATTAAASASAGGGARSPYAPPVAALQSSGVHADGEVVYAGFWKRVAAYVIDGFVVSIASYAVQLPLLFTAFGSLNPSSQTPGAIGAGMGAVIALAYIVPIAIQMVYFAWFHASGQQATLGKMAIGIKVVDERGARISFLRGVARYFSTIVSSLILCIGYVMAGFTERKQALHDMMCSTLVVDKWAYTANPEWQRRELGTVTVVILVIGGLLAFLAIAGIAVAIGMAARYGH